MSCVCDILKSALLLGPPGAFLAHLRVGLSWLTGSIVKRVSFVNGLAISWVVDLVEGVASRLCKGDETRDDVHWESGTDLIFEIVNDALERKIRTWLFAVRIEDASIGKALSNSWDYRLIETRIMLWSVRKRLAKCRGQRWWVERGKR